VPPVVEDNTGAEGAASSGALKTSALLFSDAPQTVQGCDRIELIDGNVTGNDAAAHPKAGPVAFAASILVPSSELPTRYKLAPGAINRLPHAPVCVTANAEGTKAQASTSAEIQRITSYLMLLLF
jgi:hypothetical protein